MTVTFIAHSAFLVEWDRFYTLFDYVYHEDYTAPLPPLDPAKPLLVFASHAHEDHFDGRVFGLLEQYPLTQFYLSHDIRMAERYRKRMGISDEAFARCTRLRADEVLLTSAGGEELSIRTVRSTDIGCAYLLCSEGKLVYHAGDLNWWHWESEGTAYCGTMAANYRRAMERLRDAVRDEAADAGLTEELTAAMVPLDPRLGEAAEGMGIEGLMKYVPTRTVFPMHLWKKYETIDRFRAAHPTLAPHIAQIGREGQRFEV